MPKKPNPAEPYSTGDVTIADAVDDTPESPAPVVLTYAGPPYTLGIQLGGTRDLIRPADFNQAEIAAFLEKYPTRSHWFK